MRKASFQATKLGRGSQRVLQVLVYLGKMRFTLAYSCPSFEFKYVIEVMPEFMYSIEFMYRVYVHTRQNSGNHACAHFLLDASIAEETVTGHFSNLLYCLILLCLATQTWVVYLLQFIPENKMFLYSL